jgi:phenylpropionate dioxygenase-like ring-hydroxylating dioxygenase large terminal subunit
LEIATTFLPASSGSAAAEGAVAASRHGLVPPRRGHASVVHLKNHWFIAAESHELVAGKLFATSLFGTPIVLFRDHAGVAGALVDHCPHRNVPLSLGSVAEGGTVRCRYHGWQFARSGECTHIPSLANPTEAKGRRALALPVREQQGFVWVYSSPAPDLAAPEAQPVREPHRFATMGQPGYTTVVQSVVADGTMYSTAENALDVPHTAFLHKGLFRSESRGITITAKVRRTADRVVAEYVGEPRPPGVVAKLLSPSGGVVTHFDRFILPSIAQVEYSIGSENHILVDSVLTPLSDFRTKIFAVVSFRTRIPGKVIAPLVKPLALRIFQQDAFMLAKQTQAIGQFGGEQFVSTEIDVLGKHIWRLLKNAERGIELDPALETEVGEVPLVV